jgi:UDP-glucose 4-epimerase
MNKVLITGAGGFVGSHLVKAELARGSEVVGIDIAPSDKVKEFLDNPNFEYVQKDITDISVLDYYISRTEIMYHLAAIADPKLYCTNPSLVLEIDLEVTQKVVKLCQMNDVKLIFSSTSEVYGKNPMVPWKECADRVLGPAATSRWCYSTSKAVGEHYCHAYGMKGLKFVILRFFNFYGPRLDSLGSGRVMTCFLDKFIKGEPVEVVAPGDQTRCFTYIDDGIAGILASAYSLRGCQETFNIGTSDEISMLNLAKEMKRIGNFDSEIKIIPAYQKYGEGYEDIFRRVPDTSNARRLLHWEPKVSLEDGIRKTIHSYL